MYVARTQGCKNLNVLTGLEPLRCFGLVFAALRAPSTVGSVQREHRHLERLHAHDGHGPAHVLSYRARHQPGVVLLRAGYALPGRHGRRHQSVSPNIASSAYTGVLRVFERKYVLIADRPSSGQTLDQFKSAAAQAPSNIAPSSSATGGTAGTSGGQIGGSTTSAAAAKSTKNAASRPETGWVKMAPIGFAAWLLL